jgi:putative ABC transport system ATP-binding protein
MIKLVDVTKNFALGNGVRALRNVSLDIAPREYVGILGPSGSGKSTLLYIIGLLDSPSDGAVLFDGQDTARLSDTALSLLRGKSIGFVFQSYYLVPHLTVLENVALPLYYQGLAPHARFDRARTQIANVNLQHRIGHLPAELSGGERQRVAIARALVTEPRLILADEPTGNLDSKSGNEILAIFERLHAQGKTVVMITHDLAIARRFPRIIRMADGILEEGGA